MTRSSPLAQPIDEQLQAAEVVGVVGIAHDHVTAGRGGDPLLQGAAVALAVDVDDPGAVRPGDLGGAVRAAVVGDDHLAPDSHLLQRPHALATQRPTVQALIQAGHDHRDLDVPVAGDFGIRVAGGPARHGRVHT